jgi:hypothetical protein
MRTLVWLAVVELTVVVPLWFVWRASQPHVRPLWRFITKREL